MKKSITLELTREQLSNVVEAVYSARSDIKQQMKKDKYTGSDNDYKDYADNLILSQYLENKLRECVR